MIKKYFFTLLVAFCLIQCKTGYTTTIMDVSRNHRFTTSLSREDVSKYKTLKIVLKGKDAYKLYKAYKKIIPKIQITDANTVHLDYRTSVLFYKNKELVETVFLFPKDLVVVGYTSKIAYDSNYVKEIFKLINER